MEWVLNLHSWIIQDGNYGDIVTGQILHAAVEFGFGENATLAEPSTPRAQRDPSLDGYDATARVVVVEADVWVVDVGILAFAERPPPKGVAVGDHLQGTSWLGVDPFFYFERLGKRPSMPSLIYTWRVREVLMQVAPFVEAGPRLRVRDESKLGWKTIERTNAWADDEGHAEYLLHCELVDVPPVRERPRS